MATVHETYEFDVPVERLYAHFSEHENLSALFGIDVERIKEGETEPNGTGSVRRLSVKGKMPFEETVIEAVPNERIVYKVTKGTPLRDHLGVMVFSSLGENRSHLDYTITLDMAVPGAAKLVAAGLSRSIRRGFPKAARAL